jgi:hypothetical protein
MPGRGYTCSDVAFSCSLPMMNAKKLSLESDGLEK